jgi:hypothetical protein
VCVFVWVAIVTSITSRIDYTNCFNYCTKCKDTLGVKKLLATVTTHQFVELVVSYGAMHVVWYCFLFGMLWCGAMSHSVVLLSVESIMYCIVLYCIVLYCIVLYCIVLYCIVLYCIVLYRTVLYCTVYCAEMYCTESYWTVLYITALDN